MVRVGGHHRLVNSSIAILQKNKPSTEVFFCQGRIKSQNSLCFIRGATLLYGFCRTLSRMLSHPLHLTCAGLICSLAASQTERCGILTELPCFLRTLSGPFDHVFRTCIPAPQALCGGIIAFISASTVCIRIGCDNYNTQWLICQGFSALF